MGDCAPFLSVLSTIGIIAVKNSSSSVVAPQDIVTLIHSTNCVQLPSHLNQSTLTASQIKFYGLPPKPTDKAGLVTWENVIAHAQHRFCDFYKHSQPLVPRLKPSAGASQTNTGIWAGNADAQRYYSSVNSFFVLSDATSPTTNSEYIAWTGLGGDQLGYYGSNNGCNSSSGRLIQSGSYIRWDQYSNKAVTLWFENAPQGEYDTTIPVAPGNTIFSHNDNDNSVAFAFIENESNGDYSSSSDVPGWETNTYQSGCSADYVVEGNVSYQGNSMSVAKFVNVNFYNTKWYSGSSNGNVGADDHDYFIMCTGGLGTCGWFSTQNAHPGPISSNGSSFNVIWDHS